MKVFYFNDHKKFSIFSKIFSRLFLRGLIVILFGDFGVGKTFLSKYFFSDLLMSFNFIKSSSYSFCDVYFLNGIYLYHFDFYRIVDFNNVNRFFTDIRIKNDFFFG